MDATTIGIIIAVVSTLAAILQLVIAYKDRQQKLASAETAPPSIDSGVPPGGSPPARPDKVVILPRRPEPFVNREDEIKQIGDALKSFSVVQLRALGGLGKTVLAIEVAHRLKEHFRDGVVHISSIDYPTLEDILNALARAFDIPVGRTPLPEKKVLIQKSFQSKRLLLVFDNVEQFDPVRDVVVDLLPSCAALITSRPPYLFPKSTSIELGPLPLNHAVELFELNAGQKLSDENKTIAGEICADLGAFPLAIELAAKQIRISQSDIKNFAKRIDAASSLEVLEPNYAGDRSVRASFLSTYSFLSESDKELFSSLGTFGGSSFSIDAIKAVSGDAKAEEGVDRLVALALVKVDKQRYGMHPLLKLFARENLKTVDPFKRMAQYFAAYVSAHSEDFEALETERANIQEAINWCSQNGENEVVIRIVQSLLGEERDYNFLTQCGHWNDALIRINQAVEASKKINDRDAEAQFLLAYGLFQYWFCNFVEARAVYEEAQKKFELTDNQHGLVRVYWQRGYIEDDVDNCAKAEELYRKALELSLQIGDGRLISISQELVGVVLYHRGKYQEARSYLLESLEESISRRDNAVIARAKRRLGGVARKLAAISPQPLRDKYVAEARTLLEESLRIERNQRGVARLHRQLGLLEQLLHNDGKAKEHFTRSLEMFRTLGAKKGVAAALYNLGTVLESEGDLDGAEQCYHESMELGRVISRRSGIALSLTQLASVAHKRGDLSRSVNLAAQAVDILSTLESLHLETAKGVLEKVTADYARQQGIEGAGLGQLGGSDGRPPGA